MIMSIHNSNIVKVDLNAIAKNYQLLLKELANEAECAAVIKSNAYGLGLLKVAQKLSKLGCSKFAVADTKEALKLRDSSLTDEIYVLNGFCDKEEEILFENNITPVIHTVEQAYNWVKISAIHNKKLPAILNIDTGMNRMGMSIDEAKKLLEEDLHKKISILYVMSGLACASDIKNPYNDLQYNKFMSFTKFIKKFPLSLANSAGVFLGKRYHLDMVRVGAELYGLRSSKTMPNLHDVLYFYSKIIHIKTIEEDGYVGYENSGKVKKGDKIATIPLGYSNGMPFSASDKGYVYVADQKCPIIGNVSMELCVIDVSKVPDNELYIGAEVEIVGDNCSIQDIAEYSGLIVHDILYNIASKYDKIYIE